MREALTRKRFSYLNLIVFAWILTAVFMNMAYAREQALRKEFAKVLVQDKWK